MASPNCTGTEAVRMTGPGASAAPRAVRALANHVAECSREPMTAAPEALSAMVSARPMRQPAMRLSMISMAGKA